jgi:hypothetical protein
MSAMIRLVASAALSFCTACQTGKVSHSPAAAAPTPRVANLHAFARLYGVLRWFHPSDAAAAIDWDRFAIDGAHRVIDAPDARTLRATLTDLIAPIAPTAHVAGPGEPFPDEPALHPASTAGLEVVAWEHEGYGDTVVRGPYASKRRHRDRVAPVPGVPFAEFWQAVDATAFRGEGQVVVTASADPAVARGDVIISADGRPASEQLAAAEALRSGSPHWKVFGGSWDFGLGPVDSTLPLRLRRGATELDVTVARGNRISAQFSHPSIDRFDDGVYYVDLGRASMTEINAVMDRLATAPGVVFDLRDYPNSNHQVLSHLLTRPDDSKAWMAVARVIRPDHTPGSVAGWDTGGWEMPVLQPHIAGRVAFLTGPGAASYAESVMGLVEHYHLGEIVGSATTGTNGNEAEIGTPTGCHIRFTSMRVTKHDGTQHHLIGIQPTIPASRTIAGVIAGRDEVLEKALVYVRGGSR